MHLKRMQVDKKWPITRKGKKFVVRPLGELNNGIPLLIILRDMLKIGRDRSEIKQILNKGNVEVNGRLKRDEKLAVKIFDVISIKFINKNYSLIVNKFRKFELVEKKDNTRINKIVGKKILKGKKTQINLNSGDNFIVKENIRVGDSVVFDKENKIQKILPLREGSKVVVIKGKHMGEKGEVDKINEDMALILMEKGASNIKLENIMAI